MILCITILNTAPVQTIKIIIDCRTPCSTVYIIAKENTATKQGRNAKKTQCNCLIKIA